MRKRFNPPLIIGLLMLSFLLVLALIPEQFATHDPHATCFVRRNPETGEWQVPPFPPDRIYLLGSDHGGRDVYSRLIYGARFTLIMAAIIAGTRFIIAMVTGMTAGWFGGISSWLVTQGNYIFSGLPILVISFVLLESYRLAKPDRTEASAVFAIKLIVLGWP